MQKVVTVHGINSKGEWQRKVEAVLRPHFDCVSIQYPHYRHLGASRLFFDLYTLAAGAVAALASYFWLYPQKYKPAVSVLIVALIVARILASRRREKVLDYFLTKLQEKLAEGDRPHVIAHSFGTYLAARALKKWPSTSFDHIVLTGSVLSHRFNWQDLNSDDRDAFRRIRNELAKKDWVARAAATAHGTIPDMGYAGLVGFKGDANYIHKTDGPYKLCPRCERGRVGSVHNVALKELGHSDHFLTTKHASSFWLPFFWGIEPCEYQNWQDLCGGAARAEDESSYSVELGQYETWLRTTPWRWTDGTLEAYIRREMEALIENLGVRRTEQQLAYLEKSSIRLIWKEVGDAMKTKTEWLRMYGDAPDAATFYQKLWRLFQADSKNLVKLDIGITDEKPGGRTMEDRILSLNPKRAVGNVLKKQFV